MMVHDGSRVRLRAHRRQRVVEGGKERLCVCAMTMSGNSAGRRSERAHRRSGRWSVVRSGMYHSSINLNGRTEKVRPEKRPTRKYRESLISGPSSTVTQRQQIWVRIVAGKQIVSLANLNRLDAGCKNTAEDGRADISADHDCGRNA